jgi:hypothetical protein
MPKTTAELNNFVEKATGSQKGLQPSLLDFEFYSDVLPLC